MVCEAVVISKGQVGFDEGGKQLLALLLTSIFSSFLS